MKKMLVTGGTVFVSRYIAEYYVAKGYDVYVLNRNSRKQSAGVTLIEAFLIVLWQIESFICQKMVRCGCNFSIFTIYADL